MCVQEAFLRICCFLHCYKIEAKATGPQNQQAPLLTRQQNEKIATCGFACWLRSPFRQILFFYLRGSYFLYLLFFAGRNLFVFFVFVHTCTKGTKGHRLVQDNFLGGGKENVQSSAQRSSLHSS